MTKEEIETPELFLIKKQDFLGKEVYLSGQVKKNALYGKTMENVRKRIDFRLIRTKDEALRVKNLNRWTQFDENLIGLHIQK